MKKALVVAIAATVAGLVIAPAGSAAGFTIGGDWRMGSFAVKADGTLRGAIDAFGSPSSKERNGEICTVRWRQHGLRIVFYNLGGNNPCRPRFGFFSTARAKSQEWDTNRGLRIGDRQRRLKRLYPGATFHRANRPFWPAGWWLVTRTSPFGTGGTYPGLLAVMKDRRVAAFQVRYPAGGD
jgi:hypothetical protein